MKRLVVLGAGTAGTMVVNKLDRVLPKSEWEIVVVEPFLVHLYQPGLLFLPLGDTNRPISSRPTKRCSQPA